MDMKVEVLPSFDKICRTCLSENTDLKTFLDTKLLIDGIEVEMSCVLEICTSLQIPGDEGFPTAICSNCEERLCNAYNFRQQAIKSEETLRNYNSITAFHTIKNENDVQDDSSEIYFQENSNIEYFENTDSEDKKPGEVSAVSYEKSDSDYEPPPNNLDSDPDYELINLKKGKRKKTGKNTNRNFSKIVQKRNTMEIYDSDTVTKALQDTKIKNKTKLVKCHLCGYLALNRRGLSLHIAHIHKEMKNRWCSTCYIEVVNLEEHKKSHECDRAFKCTFCDKSFRHQGHLTEHIRSHSGERPYKCDNCNKGFVSARHLRIHMRVHTGEKPYQCDICLKRFTQKGALASHSKRHARYKCKLCDLNFTKLKYLAQHILETSHGENQDNNAKSVNLLKNETIDPVDDIQDEKDLPNIEDEDFKIENEESNLENLEDKIWGTENIQTGPKYIASVVDNENECLNKGSVCQVCDKRFSSHPKLRLHMRLHTGDTPYSCNFCKKRFCTRAQLDVHVRTHTGEKPHVCHICGKGFAQSSVLNTHMKLHTGRPEQCSICEQRFCRPAELRLHMRKHTGEKPYLCTECGQTFIQSSHLVEHKRTHSDERPFPCPHCKRAFKHKTTLRSHIQIHTGEKPFKCKHCSYACRQSYSLTQHMRQHADSNLKQHECPACWKRFSSIHLLKAHTENEHEVIIA